MSQPETGGAALELAALTWTEFAALPRERLVGILPVGAVEAHGPHLSLLTDGIIAGAMASAGAEILARAGWTAVVLPGLDYVAAPFADAFPGTLSVTAETVTALVADLALAWTRQGARALALANAHLDPAHLAALEAAVVAARSRGSVPVVFPNVARKPWALRLTEELRSGACHAGQYETSIVLAAQPERVRQGRARQLAANPRSLSEAIRAGQRTFAEAGGPMAYFGDPAAATAEEGRATIHELGGIVADAVIAALGGEG
ncbi:MAG TPA: creatininase family protein [Thermoanaerobaculia bacterium]|nr:creatininase family protein [Thermoanaerobaculia bacterium]